MVRIAMPEKVEFILTTLMENGYEAYAVGGCVRDTILGREPGDWDITTSAKPEEVKDLFPRTVDTGIAHGTVTIMLDKDGFEVTTYRIDGEYEDSRHPKNVAFTSNLSEDLRRRDFTINAMAYNHTDGLVDIFGGIEDIERKVIRCVGSPMERFDEDALRILRAIRFAGQLGFSIEEDTLAAIRVKAPTLERISQERIRVELDKLILSNQVELLLTASETGICNIVLPEFDSMLKQEQDNPHHIYSVGIHSLVAVSQWNKYRKIHPVDSKLASVIAWTLLLHDSGKPHAHTKGKNGIDHFYGHAQKSANIAKDVLRRLKFDNFTIDLAVRLIKWHDYRFQPQLNEIRKAASKIGPDIMEYLFWVQRMDTMAKNPKYQDEKIEKLEEIISLYHEIIMKKQCLSIRELAVNGKDLMEKAQIPAGPEIGEVLSDLLSHVLEYPEDNTKEALFDYLNK